MMWSELNEEETNKMIIEALDHIEKNSEHTLTWEELKEKAKELGYEYDTYKTLKDSCEREFLKIRLDFNEYLLFWATGKIQIVYVGGCEITISENRTPEQMLMIMEALK